MENKQYTEQWISRIGTKNIPKKITKDLDDTLSTLSIKHTNLAEAYPNQTLTQAELHEIVVALSNKASTAVFRTRIYALIQILEHGRDYLDWEVHIPSLPALTHRETNRFKVGVFATDQANLLYNYFICDLSQPVPPTLYQRFGQILLSAIMFGGLLNPRTLFNFLSAIVKMFHLEPGVLVVPIQNEKHIYLWFADPITQSLLIRWGKDYQQDARFLAEIYYTDRAIQSYLEHIKFSITVSLPQIRQQLKDRLSLRLAPFLIDFAIGINRSVSLPVTTWQRIYTSKALILINNLTENEELHLPKPAESYIAQPTINDLRQQKKLWEKLVKKAGKHFNNHAEFRRTLENFCTDHENKLSPALYYIISWGIELVTNITSAELTFYRGREKHKLRPSSAMKYMSDIARDLLTEAGSLDLADLDGEELHDVYDQSIQLASGRNSTKGTTTIADRCAEGLYRFHGYLQKRHGALYVDFSDLIQFKDKTLDVDANLISYTEFDRALLVLGAEDTNTTELQKMQIIVFILGFELGLRRGECLRLRLCDIQFCDRDSMILVRNNRFGQAKSLSSVRKLPIGILLRPTSFNLIACWHKRRSMEVGDPASESLFLCESDNRSTPALNDLYGPIRQALHQVTGDATLRYHHLRHSFSNWTLLRLIRHTLPEARAPFLDHQVFTQQSCDSLREGLLRNGTPGRGILYELARLLGHESPQTTLLSYVHILDWILAQSCSESECNPDLTAEAISKLTGLPIDKLYSWRKKQSAAIGKSWKLSQFLPHLEMVSNAWQTEMDEANLTVIQVLRQNNEEEFRKFQRIIPLALDALHKGEKTDKLAQSIDVQSEKLISWQRNVHWIRALRTSYNKPRHINGSQLKRGVDFFPLPAKLESHKALYSRIIKTFAARSRTEQVELKKFIKYFLLNFSISAKGVQFSNEDFIERFISRLLEFGVFQKEICLIFSVRNAGIEKLEEEKNRLSKAYPSAKNISVISYDGKKDKLYPITIRVIDPDNAKNKTENGVYHANYGFRYAMYILAAATFEEFDLS